MDVITYTAFRQNLAKMLDKVNEDHSPIYITRQNGEHAVLMSADDFRSYQETAYLMASPKNAEILNRSIQQLEAGDVVHHDLIEDDE